MSLLTKIKMARYGFDKNYFRKTSFRIWVKSCFLTLKYVDKFNVFPAIQFRSEFVLKIKKSPNSLITIEDKIVLECWGDKKNVSTITVKEGGRLNIENRFLIGDEIKILIDSKASLILKGKKNESESGITGKSTILVKEYLEIGYDCIIAWDTFLTDCDWHSIEGKHPVSATILEDKVWIGVGAKVLKGSIIKDSSIVTANSVVTGGEFESGSMISGIPAKIVKSNIPQWSREMKL